MGSPVHFLQKIPDYENNTGMKSNQTVSALLIILGA
jgi:hypothetical protein